MRARHGFARALFYGRVRDDYSSAPFVSVSGYGGYKYGEVPISCEGDHGSDFVLLFMLHSCRKTAPIGFLACEMCIALKMRDCVVGALILFMLLDMYLGPGCGSIPSSVR